jgi:hypothetical protein
MRALIGVMRALIGVAAALLLVACTSNGSTPSVPAMAPNRRDSCEIAAPQSSESQT